jgi:hypothetical protein
MHTPCLCLSDVLMEQPVVVGAHAGPQLPGEPVDRRSLWNSLLFPQMYSADRHGLLPERLVSQHRMAAAQDPAGSDSGNLHHMLYRGPPGWTHPCHPTANRSPSAGFTQRAAKSHLIVSRQLEGMYAGSDGRAIASRTHFNSNHTAASYPLYLKDRAQQPFSFPGAPGYDSTTDTSRPHNATYVTSRIKNGSV